jgi:light-regulated signal transduction histidine kinase (bacteriophytochrome)
MAFNISITQGESYDLIAAITNASGQAINISGYNVRGQVRYSYGSTGIMLDLAPDIVSAVSGIIQVSLTPSETASLPVTIAVYDIEKYSENNVVVNKILNGTFTISPEVTR